MDALTLSILFFLGLVIFSAAPLVLGILAARSNTRFRLTAQNDAIFWAIVAAYLALLMFPAFVLIGSVSTPQPEGLGSYSAVIVLGAAGFPGSILPLTTAIAVDEGSLPRPIGLGSMSTWLVIGTLCWQFFLIVGVRWLVQLPSRKRRPPSIGAREPTLTGGAANP